MYYGGQKIKHFKSKDELPNSRVSPLIIFEPNNGQQTHYIAQNRQQNTPFHPKKTAPFLWKVLIYSTLSVLRQAGGMGFPEPGRAATGKKSESRSSKIASRSRSSSGNSLRKEKGRQSRAVSPVQVSWKLVHFQNLFSQVFFPKRPSRRSSRVGSSKVQRTPRNLDKVYFFA